MRHISRRSATIGTVVGLAAATAAAALAAGQGHVAALRGSGFVGTSTGGLASGDNGFGPRGGGFGPRGGGFSAAGLAPGGFGPGAPGPASGLGRGGFAAGGLAPGRVGGAGILGADILTPAASYLGLSLATLESALAHGTTLSQEATTAGKTSAELINAIVASEQTVLDADKAAGWLTSAQESALVTAYTAELTNLVDNGPPVPRSGARPAAGLAQTAASFLGLTPATLWSDLKSGKTLAALAAAAGKTAADLVMALEAPQKARLDAAVSAGTITSAQEATILADMTTRLTAIVNGSGAAGGSGWAPTNGPAPPGQGASVD